MCKTIDISVCQSGVWKSSSAKGLGLAGETWHDVTSIRAYGVSYLNNFKYPIFVLVSYTATAGSTTYAFVNGVNIQFSGAHATTERDNLSFIVPPGATYGITRLGGDYLNIWSELY